MLRPRAAGREGALWYVHVHQDHGGVAELRQNLSRYLRRVECGERLLVTDRNRPVAADLVSCELVLTEVPRAIRRLPRATRSSRSTCSWPAGETLDALALLC